jgi:general secretion pathway protein D
MTLTTSPPMSLLFLQRRCVPAFVIAALCVSLWGCASPALRDAEQLSLEGQHEQALKALDSARREKPADASLRSAQTRQRELTIATLAVQAESARLNGQVAAADSLLARIDAIDAEHPRAQSLRLEIQRSKRHQKLLGDATRALDAGNTAEAESKLREVLIDAPSLPAARALQQRISERNLEAVAPSAMSAAFQKRLTVEFRDAPLRSVFESISRSAGVNFVFDRDVKADTKITIFLRDVTLDEALRVVLSTQQLDRKLLNDSSLFVYPNTPTKQQEHQELMTRSFYLVNADVKQAQTLIKTMAKTRDVFIDERLNLIIVRDTPEVIKLTERLIASIDLPEPEVMLEVEVMEIGTNRLNELGVQWPETIQYGLPGVAGQVQLGQRFDFKATIANPALIATLRGDSGTTNLIANPKLRARNREKAKVQIGERLPVFTTSAVATGAATANAVATSVTYIETGLKLEVEPSVQLDNDVVMKVSLEVNNLIGQVSGPQGAIAYRVGTRNATTSLRLRDGETQILAGLINDEDRKAVKGLPGVSELPVLGRLFGVHTDTRTKSELVLLITPRVVRNLGLPDAATLSGAAGSFANPGAANTRLRAAAKVGLAMSNAASSAATARPAAGSVQNTATAVIEVSTTGQAAAGETVSITLLNRSVATVRGQLSFDATLLRSTAATAATGAAATAADSKLDFELDASGQRVFVLRVLPGANGKSSDVQLEGLSATLPGGTATSVQVEGDMALRFVAR